MKPFPLIRKLVSQILFILLLTFPLNPFIFLLRREIGCQDLEGCAISLTKLALSVSG